MAPNASLYNSYLAYVSEDTQGETPSSPSMLKLRTTDPLALEGGRDTFQSEEVISHRQRENLRAGRETISGTIPAELSYGAFDDWLEAALGGSWSDETAGTPEVLKVGNNVQTFSVEQGFGDISQYQVFKGVTPTGFSIEANPDGIVSCDFPVIGMGHDPLDDTSLGSASDVASNDPFDGLENASIEEGGSSIAIVTSVSFSVENGRTVSGLVGTNENSSPTNGMVTITGELTARFQDQSLLNKFKDETESSLMLQFNDLGGSDSLKFNMPRIKYTGESKSENDNNVDVTLPFEALYDETEASAIVIERSNAA